ncbi:DNA utilization protein GntX [uncultured Clostridium sp.]|uniref:ComF family protein n=1 Tax=uncultured Clostridium sp. TaxID=59620 RepID=UPI0008210224|nr:ComF family protein [uncultured Clostridium sp.]SCJ90528.1 DNA utilization protein GntX [uncultured Clostridium sp.]
MGKKIIKEIKNIVETIIDIIYPPSNRCIICNAEDFIGICPYCKSKIKRVENQEDVLSYGYYGGVLKELILAFKYDKNFTAGNVISELLLNLIYENRIEFDAIYYVPMSKSSIKKRGFNQCEIIAKNLSKSLNIPVSNSLIKIKNTKEQKSLSKDERYKNIKGAFKIRENNIKNKRILLVDDVVTTGATLLECKKVLENYDIEEITVLTIAKSHI